MRRHLANCELLNLKPGLKPETALQLPAKFSHSGIAAMWAWSCYIKSGKSSYEVANFPGFNTWEAFWTCSYNLPNDKVEETLGSKINLTTYCDEILIFPHCDLFSMLFVWVVEICQNCYCFLIFTCFFIKHKNKKSYRQGGDGFQRFLQIEQSGFCMGATSKMSSLRNFTITPPSSC